jgi:hypothetical protein
MATADDVTIVMDGPLARVAPACEDVLGPLLRYGGYGCAAGGPRGYRLERRPGRAYRRGRDGQLVTLAGLVPRLRRELERQGRRVVLVSGPTGQDTRLVPDQGLLDAAAGEARAYLRALIGNQRGQVLIGPDGQLVGLIGLGCRLFPRARALVVTTTRRRVGALARRLGRLLPGSVAAGVRLGAGPHLGARVLVTTRQSFGHAAHDTDPFDWLLFADACRVIDASVSWPGLAAIKRQKVVGFVRRGEVPSPATRLYLEGVCGPVIYEAPGPGGRQARVRVIFAEPPLTPKCGAGDALAHKRQCVWHNESRNRALAVLATALAAGDDEPLRRQGLLRPDLRLPVAGLIGRRVAVLVESTEHGRELTRLLPGWPLCASLPSPVGSRRPASGPPTRGILTLAAATAAGPLDVDVLVRAGGGGGPLELPGFPTPALGARQEVLVLDLADADDARAEADTRRRLRDYERRGWEVSAPPRLGLPDEPAHDGEWGRRRRG